MSKFSNIDMSLLTFEIVLSICCLKSCPPQVYYQGVFDRAIFQIESCLWLRPGEFEPAFFLKIALLGLV